MLKSLKKKFCCFYTKRSQAGGFNNLIKDADYSDGLMDVVIIKIVILLMWHQFFQSCGKGIPDDNKNVIKLKTKRCLIESYDDIAVAIDGEEGCCLPANIEFVQRVLRYLLIKKAAKMSLLNSSLQLFIKIFFNFIFHII